MPRRQRLRFTNIRVAFKISFQQPCQGHIASVTAWTDGQACALNLRTLRIFRLLQETWWSDERVPYTPASASVSARSVLCFCRELSHPGACNAARSLNTWLALQVLSSSGRPKHVRELRPYTHELARNAGVFVLSRTAWEAEAWSEARALSCERCPCDYVFDLDTCVSFPHVCKPQAPMGQMWQARGLSTAVAKEQEWAEEGAPSSPWSALALRVGDIAEKHVAAKAIPAWARPSDSTTPGQVLLSVCERGMCSTKLTWPMVATVQF